jgi:hypothetical protein
MDEDDDYMSDITGMDDEYNEEGKTSSLNRLRRNSSADDVR